MVARMMIPRIFRWITEIDSGLDALMEYWVDGRAFLYAGCYHAWYRRWEARFTRMKDEDCGDCFIGVSIVKLAVWK